MPIVNFLSPSYESRSRNVSSKRALNLYPQMTDGNSKSPMILIGTPGTTTFTREILGDIGIASIKGDGAPVNVVSVTTSAAHGYAIGQIINITGTDDYDQLSVTIAFISGSTSFTYQTIENSSTNTNTVGTINATGESPITTVDIASPCLGLHYTSTGRLFAVFSEYLYEVYANGTYERRGLPIGASANISMASDGRSLVIVNGFIYYVYDLVNDSSQTIDTISMAGFDNPTKVRYLDGRIVITNNDPSLNNNNKFFWTNVLDATVIDPLGYATGESSADVITAIEVLDGQLWVFGPQSYEAWRTDTNPDLPWVKVGGSSSQIGCGAQNGVTKIGSHLYWLGSSTAGKDVVYKSNGSSAERISNHAIEYLIGQLGGSTSDAQFFSYQQEGHEWLCISFIQGNKTICYDIGSGSMWHERSTRDLLTNAQNRWSPLYTVFAFDQVITGDGDSARLFTLSLDKYTEFDGRPIVREFVSPVYFQDYRQCLHKDFEIDIETGIGLQYGLTEVGIQQNQGVNPQIMLQYSDDAGHTFSSERWTNLGKTGQYRAKARWRNLGKTAERVYKITISDPVKVVILGARILMDVSRNR